MAQPELSIELHNEENLLFNGIRILYPNLWRMGEWKDEPSGYDAVLLLPKDYEDGVKYLQWYIAEIAKANDIKLRKGITCVRDADDEGKTEPPYGGHFLIRVRNKKYPPRIFDPDMAELLNETDQFCYSGSYCNVLTSGWGMTGEKHGKPYVGLNLRAIQHIADGERIGGSMASDGEVASAFGADPKKPNLGNMPASSGPTRISGDNSQESSHYGDWDDDIPF